MTNRASATLRQIALRHYRSNAADLAVLQWFRALHVARALAAALAWGLRQALLLLYQHNTLSQQDGHAIAHCCVLVDDLLLAAKSVGEVQQVKKLLRIGVFNSSRSHK
jgi:hypothetical protein